MWQRQDQQATDATLVETDGDEISETSARGKLVETAGEDRIAGPPSMYGVLELSSAPMNGVLELPSAQTARGTLVETGGKVPVETVGIVISGHSTRGELVETPGGECIAGLPSMYGVLEHSSAPTSESGAKLVEIDGNESSGHSARCGLVETDGKDRIAGTPSIESTEQPGRSLNGVLASDLGEVDGERTTGSGLMGIESSGVNIKRNSVSSASNSCQKAL